MKLTVKPVENNKGLTAHATEVANFAAWSYLLDINPLPGLRKRFPDEKFEFIGTVERQYTKTEDNRKEIVPGAFNFSIYHGVDVPRYDGSYETPDEWIDILITTPEGCLLIFHENLQDCEEREK